MSSPRFFLTLLLLSFSSESIGAGIVNTLPLAKDNTGKPVPRFVNGYTLFYDRDQGTVEAFDRAGSRVMNVTLSLPDLGRINIVDVTASTAGRVVVLGSAISRDRTQFASVLIWIRPDGQTEKVVRLNPYAATRILFSGNGHLWAAGMARDSSFQETPEHDVLIEFDEHGEFVKSVLPRSMFAGAVGHPAGGGYLATSGDRIGLYSEMGRAYVEYDLAGHLIGKWGIAHLPNVKRPTGVGLTSNGEFYVGGWEKSKEAAAGRAVVYRLDRTTGQFVQFELPGVDATPKMLGLLGVDKDDLVLHCNPPSLARISGNP
jgi:hypothetical protein